MLCHIVSVPSALMPRSPNVRACILLASRLPQASDEERNSLRQNGSSSNRLPQEQVWWCVLPELTAAAAALARKVSH